MGVRAPFRLYVVDGCSHCESAAGFLVINRLPFDAIAVNDDPFLEPVVKDKQFPILVAYPFKESVVGFKREEYERLVLLFHTGNDPRKRNGDGVTLPNPSAMPGIVVQQKSVSQETS